MKVHPPSITERIVDRLRGREQLLVRAAAPMPLLLFSYPRGFTEIASEIRSAIDPGFSMLPAHLQQMYADVLQSLHGIIVVILRQRNVCGCLGHHHPAGTESALARRLAVDLGSPVGEIDIAWEDIRKWEPQPLAAMATGSAEEMRALHYPVAVLSVMLHELEHLAAPDLAEAQVRSHSNGFYEAVMRELARTEYGITYGMSGPSS